MVINVSILLDMLSDNNKYQQLSIMQWLLIKMEVKYRDFAFYRLLYFY